MMMGGGVPTVHPRSLETVNLAAQAFTSTADPYTPPPPPPPPPSKPWLSWLPFSPFSCFRPNPHRVTHAPPSPSPSQPLSVPITLPSSSTTAANSNPNHLPFAVPPSSPATSLTLSPASLTLSPTSAGPITFSPAAGPASIFAVGPYAHDTRLVSPPVFSTEPSTAPFTPPPESLLLTTTTTPPSPEVPFAHFLTTSPHNSDLFTAYQFPPGSSIGQLISPTSASSTRSSPYRESFFLPLSEPPEAIVPPKLTPWHTRKDGSLLDGSISAKERIEDVKERIADVELERRRDDDQVLDSDDCQLSVSVKNSKEFVFGNSEVNNMSGEAVGVRGSDTEIQKNWPFLPIIESSVSR